MADNEALQGGKAEPVQLSKSPSGPPMGFPGSVGKAVNAILDEIAAALYPALGQDFTPSPTARRAQARLGVRARNAARRERLELRGFGAFTVTTWSTRPGRNPRTGVSVSVPETHHPAFRMAKEMNARLNGTHGSALRAAFHNLPD